MRISAGRCPSEVVARFDITVINQGRWVMFREKGDPTRKNGLTSAINVMRPLSAGPLLKAILLPRGRLEHHKSRAMSAADLL